MQPEEYEENHDEDGLELYDNDDYPFDPGYYGSHNEWDNDYDPEFPLESDDEYEEEDEDDLEDN